MQCYHGGGQPWDNHGSIVSNITRLAGESDQPIAALLTDLKQRGMLDETLVIWGGEMGRTPTVQKVKDPTKVGRDHHIDGYTIWMAGGGVRGGMTLRSHRRIGDGGDRKQSHDARFPCHPAASVGIRSQAVDLSLLGPRFPLDGCPRTRHRRDSSGLTPSLARGRSIHRLRHAREQAGSYSNGAALLPSLGTEIHKALDPVQSVKPRLAREVDGEDWPALLVPNPALVIVDFRQFCRSWRCTQRPASGCWC